MAESFLEEQIKRIRQMTEQMSRVRPLSDVHNVGVHSSEWNESNRHEHAPVRKDMRRSSSRRRGR
jgi:hypothetical protein